MTDTTNYCWCFIKTKRGTVRVELSPDGEIDDMHAYDPANWDSKTWKRERPRLIRRARAVCAKIGAKDAPSGRS